MEFFFVYGIIYEFNSIIFPDGYLLVPNITYWNSCLSVQIWTPLLLWTSLVAQTVKHLPTMWRPGFDPWVRKIPWRREWQPTPILLPGESHGWRILVGYSPWVAESDKTEWLHFLSFLSLSCTKPKKWKEFIFSHFVCYMCPNTTHLITEVL